MYLRVALPQAHVRCLRREARGDPRPLGVSYNHLRVSDLKYRRGFAPRRTISTSTGASSRRPPSCWTTSSSTNWRTYWSRTTPAASGRSSPCRSPGGRRPKRGSSRTGAFWREIFDWLMRAVGFRYCPGLVFGPCHLERDALLSGLVSKLFGKRIDAPLQRRDPLHHGVECVMASNGMAGRRRAARPTAPGGGSGAASSAGLSRRRPRGRCRRSPCPAYSGRGVERLQAHPPHRGD